MYLFEYKKEINEFILTFGKKLTYGYFLKEPTRRGKTVRENELSVTIITGLMLQIYCIFFSTIALLRALVMSIIKAYNL